jgi:hypothetical protein
MHIDPISSALRSAWRSLRPTARAALATAALLGLSQSAHAFFEDVCYLPNGGGLTSCTPLPATCSLQEPVSTTCRLEALAVLGLQQMQSIPGRSSVHTDVTYVLAQAVGFAERDAYWIAAYDEAADLGSFVARDASGQALSTEKPTATIDGVVRNNMATAGFLLHFHAPRHKGTSLPGQVDGLHPDVDDPDTEVVVDHLRRWAMYEPKAPACTSGLTVRSAGGNYTRGSTCFVDAKRQPGHVMGSIGAIAGLAVPFNPPPATGLQVMATTTATGSATIYSDQFDSYINKADGFSSAKHAANARLGLYLHVLADRVSHHVCTDAAVLTDPNSSGTFSEYMDNPDCTQPLHALRHMYETGVNFAALLPKDQTTLAAIQLVYDELVVFAQARGVLNTRAKDAAFRQRVLDAIGLALQAPQAADRVGGLARVACREGWTPFPGAPTCAATLP